MRLILAALLLALFSSLAFAGNLVPLKAPASPYTNAEFSHLCHVNGLDASGNLTGTCQYYGAVRNTGGPAVVTWGPDGTALTAVVCVNIYNQSDTCPSSVYTPPVQSITLNNGQTIRAWVQATTSLGYTAVVVDTLPQISGVITP